MIWSLTRLEKSKPTGGFEALSHLSFPLDPRPSDMQKQSFGQACMAGPGKNHYIWRTPLVPPPDLFLVSGGSQLFYCSQRRPASLNPSLMPGKINQNIKSIRELKNYTQQYMSEQLGITQAGYSRIEKGDARMSFERLEQIAVVLGMSPQSLIGFENDIFLLPRGKGRTIGDSSLVDVESLYRDKIGLLEKLLGLAEAELKNYKSRCGEL
ncbi:helix-turn-helix domain-containing protein [Flavobacterium mesophilum]|uniref:helix-turn-helix domain-containing protein n=1 Tax=Flavobacterium mesophilum TaxID=3143495 RepID=UPI0031E0D910